MKDKVILEKKAQEFIDKTSNPPFLYELPVEMARKKLEELQNQPVYKFPANVLKINFITMNVLMFIYLFQLII